MRKFIFFGILLLGHSFLFAQEEEHSILSRTRNVIPPSPNAAALGKFGDIPVGLSTGIPEITIPIYNWLSSRKDFSLNISLSYHAGGIRIDDIPSFVGLGWALNCGGMISRTVRGLPDDKPEQGYINSDVLPNSSTYDYNNQFIHTRIDGMTSSDVSISLARNYDNTTSTEFTNLNSIAAGFLDAEQDVFQYSFNGRTGRFILNKNHSIVQLEDSKMQIILI